jgi:cell division protein FtsX
MIVNKMTASTGAAIKNTTASSAFNRKETINAVIIITGERKPGRIPFVMEFWSVVTSLVSLVTREGVLNRSVLAKE